MLYTLDNCQNIARGMKSSNVAKFPSIFYIEKGTIWVWVPFTSADIIVESFIHSLYWYLILSLWKIRKKQKLDDFKSNNLINLIWQYKTKSETPQATVQQHRHTIWDIINTSVCYMYHKVKTSHCCPLWTEFYGSWLNMKNLCEGSSYGFSM